MNAAVHANDLHQAHPPCLSAYASHFHLFTGIADQKCSIIAGRAIKNEYLALGTLGLTGLLTSLAMGGGKKEASPPSDAKQTIQQVKEAVKFESSSRCVSVSVRKESQRN